MDGSNRDGPAIAEKLAAHVCRPVGEAERARAALHLLDWLGCAAVGAAEEAGRVLAAYGLAAAPGPATCFGAGRRDAPAAALVNGGLGNLLELDDIHRTSIVHPGDVVIPAVLAAAEREGAPEEAVADAIVAGYEAAIRVGIAAGPQHYEYWYNSATCGVFGAAAGVARLCGAGRRQLAQALALAGMQAAGLWQCRLEPNFGKQLATGRAAQSGMLAADLALRGFTGPLSIFEGPLGFFAAMADGADPARLLPGGEDAGWLIHDVSFKPWPACRHAHPVIEAALLARAALGADEAIGTVEIETYRQAVAFCDDPDPDTPHRGRFSLQHCFAVAWLHGAPDFEDFSPAALSDPRMAALRTRVTVKEARDLSAAFPEAYGARVTVSGPGFGSRTFDIATAKGDPENPMTLPELGEKAAGLIGRVRPGLARTIDAAGLSIGGLMSLFRKLGGGADAE